jgi:hypothetical protein
LQNCEQDFPPKPSNNAKSMSRRDYGGGTLTLEDARHIVLAEGVLSRRELIIQIVWALAIAGLLAWAIVAGQATFWHMLVPMFAEYLACIVVLPFLQVFYRNADLKKDSRSCLRLIAFIIAGLAIACFVRSRMFERSFFGQFSDDWAVVWNWVVGFKMHWAILAAGLHASMNVTRSVRHLVRHGPPYMGPGLGCGMRITVIILAVIVVPAFGMLILGVMNEFGLGKFDIRSWISPAWILWALLLTAELATLAMRCDLQRRLERAGKLPIETDGD